MTARRRIGAGLGVLALGIGRLLFVWLGGLFNDKPAIDGRSGLAFPSDHTDVALTPSCPTTDAERRAASAVFLLPILTTSAP